MALFGACFATGLLLVGRMWFKWQDSPVLISIESTDVANALLDFPTVDVCPVNKVSSGRLDQYMTSM